MTGAGFAQTLVLGGVAQPDATRKQQQQAAVQVGMAVSAQGLEQRFNASAVTFMQALLEAGLTALVSSDQKRALLPQFNGVYITDCTRLEWGKTGVKLGVKLIPAGCDPSHRVSFSEFSVGELSHVFSFVITCPTVINPLIALS